MPNDFSELSIKLTKEISKATKKNEGIFFTHPIIVERIIKYIKTKIKMTDIKILEPSCGSGEFIEILDKTIRKKTIHAIELNETIYNEVSKKIYSDAVKFFNQDYLQYDTNDQYNLIIGNPPYFVIPKKDVPKKYQEHISGRPNIFCLFVLHSLYKLANDGILVFVLPNSFMNSSYYEKVRKLISEKYDLFKIMNFKNDPLFKDTLQPTSAFFIKNKIRKTPSPMVYEFNGISLFTDQKKLFQNLVKNTKTLTELGFTVKNGDTIWNKFKDILTDNNKETILVYSSNIKNNKFKLTSFPNNEKKKQYIKRTGLTGPRIIIPRGYGNSQYVFNYALLNIDGQYLLENHIISIFYEDDNLSKDEILKKLNNIIKSFKQKKTSKFVDIFSGNNALNTTEIQNMLPIYGF